MSNVDLMVVGPPAAHTCSGAETPDGYLDSSGEEGDETYAAVAQRVAIPAQSPLVETSEDSTSLDKRRNPEGVLEAVFYGLGQYPLAVENDLSEGTSTGELSEPTSEVPVASINAANETEANQPTLAVEVPTGEVGSEVEVISEISIIAESSQVVEVPNEEATVPNTPKSVGPEVDDKPRAAPLAPELLQPVDLNIKVETPDGNPDTSSAKPSDVGTQELATASPATRGTNNAVPVGIPIDQVVSTAPPAPETVSPSGFKAVLGDAQSAAPEQRPVWEQLAAVIKPVRLQADGSHRISIALHPEELGAVHLEVSLRDGALSLRAVAEHLVSRDLLQASLPQLRAELTKAGVQLGNVDVGDQTTTGNREPGQQNAQDVAAPRRAAPAMNANNVVANSSPRPGEPVRVGPGALSMEL